MLYKTYLSLPILELENQRDDMCQNPEAVTNILGEDFDKNDMKLKELGLMRSTDGFDWPKQCGMNI